MPGYFGMHLDSNINVDIPFENEVFSKHPEKNRRDMQIVCRLDSATDRLIPAKPKSHSGGERWSL